MKQLIIYLAVALLCSHSCAQLASPNDAGLTFGHVHLNVADVEEHIEIWMQHFNSEVIADTLLSAIRFPDRPQGCGYRINRGVV
jgi:catechol-2,3-dioxygenase